MSRRRKFTLIDAPSPRGGSCRHISRFASQPTKAVRQLQLTGARQAECLSPIIKVLHMYGYYMARLRKMVICPKCGERKKIIENETKTKKEKKVVSKCTALKSDPPALRTGIDKFRMSFLHVQRLTE